MVSPVEVADVAVAVHHSSALPSVSSGLPSFLLGDEQISVGYSKFSYYTTLGLYVLSFPGLWSVVKRATKTK